MASSARIDELRKKFDENPRRYFAPLANEFRKAGDLEQAVFICQEYLPQQPGHMSGHIVYGQALFELGRDEEAKAVFETALSLDPENLIALRHLGDIARQAGDLDVARFWYQRVLESDPRNEEISQVLMSMDGLRGESAEPGTAAAPAAAAEPAAEAVSDSAFRAPPADVEAAAGEAKTASEPPPVPSAASEPDAYEPFEGFDRNIEFGGQNTDSAAEPEGAAEAVPDEPAIAEAAAGEPAGGLGESVHADEHELLDLDDFSIGGADIEVGSEESAEATTASSDASFELPPIESGMPADDEPADFAAPGAAIEPETASVSFEDVSIFEEPHADVDDLNTSFEPEPLSDAGSAAMTFEPESAASGTGAAPALDESPTLDPEQAPEPSIELATDINLGLPADDAAAPTEPQPESGAHADHFEPVPELPDEPRLGIDGEAETSVEPAANVDEVFATETMANLYVEQGHLANALEIYDKLLAHSPADPRLQERARAIRERIYGKPREAVWEPEPVAADVGPAHVTPAVAAASAAGPTIREFLRGVISRRAMPSTADAVELPAEPESRSPTSTETVTGSIDALFANASASEEDRSAANALAQAFGEWPEPTPIGGVPAHEASSELSLDHVFKANAPVPRREDADAFSFDQFFSEDLGEQPANGENPSERAKTEGSEDIAQFNAWLNGLKKT